MKPFQLLLLLFPLLLAQSDTTDAKNDESVSEAVQGGPHFDPISILFCIVLMGFGLTYAFYGYKLYRLTLFLTGFTIFGEIALAIVLLTNPPDPAHKNPKQGLLFLTIIVGIGTLGGMLLVGVGRRAVPVIGLLGGVVVASIIRTMAPLLHFWMHVIIFTVCSVCGVVGIMFYQRPTIIFATSVAGAFITIIGIDLVVGEGLVYHGVSRDINGSVHVSVGGWIELGCALVLALLGMAFQFWKHVNYEFAEPEASKTNYRASSNPILLE